MEPQQSASSSSKASGPSASVNATGAAASKKRKTPGEYSRNPNTIRVRQRLASLSPYRREVERARSNDLKAVSTAWKDRTNTETFKSASGEVKKKMLEEVEKAVMDRRRRKGIDFNSKVALLNQQFKPDQPVFVQRPVHAGSASRQPLPTMAPPGYVPFPVQPIPKLMAAPKGKSSAAGPSHASSSGVRPHDQSDKELIAGVDAGLRAHFDFAIDELKVQIEAERRSFRTAVDGLQGTIQNLQDQFLQMMTLFPPSPHALHLPPTPHSYAPSHHSGQQFDYYRSDGMQGGDNYNGGGRYDNNDESNYVVQ